jgi:hypothetical protein
LPDTGVLTGHARYDEWYFNATSTEGRRVWWRGPFYSSLHWGFLPLHVISCFHQYSTHKIKSQNHQTWS